MLPGVASAPPLITLARALGWEPAPLTIKEGRRFAAATAPAQPAPQPAPIVTTPVLLEIEDLRAGYAGHPVLHSVSLTLRAGEVLAVLGRNGSGKSTLLKCVTGLIKPERGAIRLMGESSAQLSVAEICRSVGYLPQDPNALLFADSAREELEITLRNHGRAPDPAVIDPLLAQLGLAGVAGRYPRDLSTGERQRVAFGAITVTGPRLLLLDEPTRGLDSAAKLQLARLLRVWQAVGAAIVLVTHDVELAAEVATRVALLSQGRIISEGDPATVLGSSPLFAPQVARLFPGTGWLTVEDVLRSL